MLKRKAYQAMAAWKEAKTTQGLLVMGARQVGKTTTIRAFAHAHYQHVAEINFFDNSSAKETVSSSIDAQDLLMRISALARVDLSGPNTLIFLDEVQELEDALTAVKFLIEETNCDVILSGSLLGLDAFSARSLPVGYLQTLQMFPLDFEEFCWARSVPEAVFKAAKELVQKEEAVPDYMHDLLIDEFYKYLLVGGMPDAVQAFVESNSLVRSRNAQKAIAELYEYDIVKYVSEKTEARQIELVYEAIPSQLDAENKRFKYTRLGKNLRFANLETAFDWLKTAGIALPAERVSEPLYPLGLSADAASFKLYMNDVGLLTSKLMGDVDLEILNRRSSINFGSIFENAAAQELRAHGFELFYYNNRSVGEIDFVLQSSRGKMLLCEIKSGKDYRRHSALNNLLSTKNYSFDRAIVFYDGNVRREDRSQKDSDRKGNGQNDNGQKARVLYVPIYAVDFLSPEQGAL